MFLEENDEDSTNSENENYDDDDDIILQNKRRKYNNYDYDYDSDYCYDVNSLDNKQNATVENDYNFMDLKFTKYELLAIAGALCYDLVHQTKYVQNRIQKLTTIYSILGETEKITELGTILYNANLYTIKGTYELDLTSLENFDEYYGYNLLQNMLNTEYNNNGNLSLIQNIFYDPNIQQLFDTTK